jgi:hypothetical protein
MSWLLFSRSLGQLQLFAGNGVGVFGSAPLGTWQAHNEVALNSGGPWPSGHFNWSHYNRHFDQLGFGPGCFSTAYGCFGIHVFSVPGRSGIGVHAGRQTLLSIPDGSPGGKTKGCIRTTQAAMEWINTTHNSDPLRAILITN